jgi:tRNA threonylcarbamoyladenosine biosynthesis protein TsaB
MLILTLRTDKPEAEIGLYENSSQMHHEVWQAHRQLAETIHTKLEDLLTLENKTIHDVEGIVVFKGPGSFTGLRIGVSVANALAYSLHIPIVASAGEDWQKDGVAKILAGESETIALPEYGAPVFITKQKK